MERPALITNKMMAKDEFSKWLMIEVLETGEGSCRLAMTIRPEMCNGFGIAHGGITYSFADSALAFASNSRGRHALSIDTSISHVRPLKSGTRIEAIARELNLSYRTGLYEVLIQTGNEPVAFFKGTVYRKDEEWMTDSR